jgi:ribonuclease T2
MYRLHEDVVDFFETTIKYYKRFPTFKWLEQAGITPSNSTGYSYADIRDILFENHGGVPFIGCNGPRYNNTAAGKAANSSDSGYTALSEVWYYEYVSSLITQSPERGCANASQAYGRPQEGNVIPTSAAPTYLTNCAKAAGAINYFQRTNGSEKVPTVPY